MKALRAGLIVLVGCGPKVDDGVFDPGSSEPYGPTAGNSTGAPDDDDDDETEADASTEEGDAPDDPSDPGTDETGPEPDTTTGAPAECPDAAADLGYTCPAGFAFATMPGIAQCRVDDIELPPGAFAYCNYLAEGVLGYGWDLGNEPPGLSCPLGARYAPNATVAYCIWDIHDLPTATTVAACQALLTEHWLALQWPCP